jgi:hypothetical protein
VRQTEPEGVQRQELDVEPDNARDLSQCASESRTADGALRASGHEGKDQPRSAKIAHPEDATAVGRGDSGGHQPVCEPGNCEDEALATSESHKEDATDSQGGQGVIWTRAIRSERPDVPFGAPVVRIR